jgi:transposase-like protein
MYEDFQLDCRACGEQFTVREYSPKALGDRDRWILECPHCAHTTTERSAGYLEVVREE